MLEKDKIKMSSLVRLIIYSVIAVMLFGALIWGLNNSSKFFNVFDTSDWNIGVSGLNYSDADKYSVGGASIDAADIKYVDVDWTNGEVDIIPAQGSGRGGNSEISFSEQSSSVIDPEYQLRWYKDGSTLYIKIWKSGFSIGINNYPEKKLTLTLPDITYEKIKIDSVSASINCAAVSASELSLETTSGDIFIDGAKCDDIETDSVSGAVTAKQITTHEFEHDSTSGDVNISGTLDVFDSSTVSGEVSLSVYAPLQTARISTVSGDVALTFAEDSVFTIDYDTVSGDAHIAMPASCENGRYSSAATSSDDKTMKFNIQTVSGSLNADKLQ